jgi:hypothetical protein
MRINRVALMHPICYTRRAGGRHEAAGKRKLLRELQGKKCLDTTQLEICFIFRVMEIFII